MMGRSYVNKKEGKVIPKSEKMQVQTSPRGKEISEHKAWKHEGEAWRVWGVRGETGLQRWVRATVINSWQIN